MKISHPSEAAALPRSWGYPFALGEIISHLSLPLAILLFLGVGWYLVFASIPPASLVTAQAYRPGQGPAGHQPGQSNLLVMAASTLVALGLLGVWSFGAGRRYKTERSWYDSEERYRALIDNSPDVVMRFDRQFRHMYVNQAITKFVKVAPAEFIGKTHRELDVEIGRVSFWEENIGQLFETGRPLTQQFEFAGISGPIVFEARFVPEFGPDGHIKTALVIARDVTERRRAELALRERIIALTQPLGDASTLKFEDLFDLAEIQAIQDSFAAATGVASIITDVNGRPITRSSNFCRLCTEVIRATPGGLLNCMKSDAAIGSPNPAGPTVQRCLSGGLLDAGASIMVGNHHIANWLIGQVLDGAPDEEKMLGYARQIGADQEEFRVALAQVTQMPRAQFDKVSQALFLIAGQLSKLAVQNVQQARDLARRQLAEAAEARHREALRHERDLVAQIMETSPVGIVLIDRMGRVAFANRRSEEILGLTRDEITQRTYNAPAWRITDAAGNALPDDQLPFRRVLATGQPVYDVQHAIIWPDGRQVMLSINAAPIFTETGEVDSIVASIEDITAWLQAEAEKDRLQDQLVQAQKMEAVGQLAGGIAHDFNNILTAIMGYTDLSLAALAADHPSRQDLLGIRASAQRAANLTRQLLAFARRQFNQPEILNLNDLILNIMPMLRRLIGEHIELVTLLAPALDRVKVDPSQFEQVVLNLVLNARDAMPDGGKLTLETANVYLDGSQLRTLMEIKSGYYVLMMVSDTGQGMTPEVKEHIFEPFFTTKEVGQGTGLGLATCFGIIKQHEGDIEVSSEPGQGSTFKVFLPAAPEVWARVYSSPVEILPQGVETILLVEDEAAVRELAARILRQNGYTVLEAANGAEAIRQVERPIQLLLTDMVMPLLGGRGLADILRARAPGLKVLFMSGYNDSLVCQDQLEAGLGYLQKPFTQESLLRQVRQLLDQ